MKRPFKFYSTPKRYIFNKHQGAVGTPIAITKLDRRHMSYSRRSSSHPLTSFDLIVVVKRYLDKSGAIDAFPTICQAVSQ